RDGSHRSNPDLGRIPRADRHARRDRRAGVDDADALEQLTVDEVGDKRPAMAVEILTFEAEFLHRQRWNEWIGIDLTVWMVQGDTHLPTTILEYEDVLHLVASRQLGITVGPHLDD